jgi:hypothetical protein
MMTPNEALRIIITKYPAYDGERIAALIELQAAKSVEQEALIHAACMELGKCTNDCPSPKPEDSYGDCAFPRMDYETEQAACAACWRKYFEQKAKEDNSNANSSRVHI